MTTLAPALRERLAACRNLSGAESAIATWFEQNLHVLLFESAAEVAAGAGVSEMSVSRFVRRLGYENFRAFKADLKAHSRHRERPELDDRLRRWSLPSVDGEVLDETLRREIEAIVDVYDLARRPVWRDALDVVVGAKKVNVTGFQASKGLALDFASRLKWVRPGVRFVEGTSGTWSEIFDEVEGSSCVVLVDTAAYARTSFRISELCLRQGLPLVIVTDRFSGWARKYTPHVLSVSTHTGTYWDSSAGLAALLGLFVNAVTARLGPEAESRRERMSALGEHFEAFAYDSDTQVRPLKPDGAEAMSSSLKEET
jgi:DNA-binding MurR/RpiR family transcriptional regulator